MFLMFFSSTLVQISAFVCICIHGTSATRLGSIASGFFDEVSLFLHLFECSYSVDYEYACEHERR